MAGIPVHRAMWVERARTLAYCLLALLVAASLGVLWATPANAATFTVNSTADPGTDGCDATECTLREAITAANNNNNAPTIDTIKFAIPDNGPHTIAPSSGLPTITESVTIDGYSQGKSTTNTTADDAKPNTLAVGNNAVLKIVLSGDSAAPEANGPAALKINATNSTVKGLVISDWNNGSGVFLNTGATGNQVTGNYIGTDASGTQDLGNNGGVAVIDANNTIGGTTAAARNIISGNGAGVEIASATGGNKVQGNYIGTNASGTEALSNNNGVVILSAPGNTIGGTTGGARNIISGNAVFGIEIIFSGATDNLVMGNYIGTDASGTEDLGNNDSGVSIQGDADDNTIGGTTAAARNIISGNGGDGVEVLFRSPALPFPDPDPATGNSILSNSIYDNDALGIDLHNNNDPEGVSANDVDPGTEDDTDDGPNRLQNFPDLDSAKTGRRTTTIKGTLNSTDNTTFTLQFFGSPEADDPSGYGEGKTFRFQKSVTTNDSGDATFTFKTRRKVPKGQVVTATATNNSTGDTSEFSEAVPVS